jgi:PAS domain S-box-containing protein
VSRTSIQSYAGAGAEQLAQDALRLAVETAPVLIAYVDRECRYVYANETYRSWFGLAPEDVRGKHLREVLGPVAFERIHLHVERALAGDRVDFEAEMPYALCPARFVRASYVPHRGAEGGVAGFVALVSDVTEAKRELARREEAERELRQSEGRFRAMADSSPHLLWVHDAEGQLKFVNRVYEVFFGVREEQVLGPGWKPLIHPEDSEAYIGAFVEAFRNRIPFRAEARVRRADGAWRWVSSVGLPWRGPGGEFLGMVGSSPDVTEAKEFEARLRETEGRFRAMADSSLVPIWVTDAEGAVNFVNRAYLEFFGVTHEQLKAPGGWHPLIHPEDCPSYVGSFFESIRRRERYHAQARARRADGAWRWLSTYAAPRFGPGGEFLGMVGSSPDVTEMKEVESRLRESAERFRAMAETVPSIVFTIAADGTCDYVNARFYELTGLPEDRALGENWTAAIHPEDAPGAFREWERCLREGVPFESRYRLRWREGGYHWFVARAVPLRGPSGSVDRWVGTATDVHALAEADRRKEEANRTLELLVEERTGNLREALRELESFSYSIAHDLRAPLRTVNSFAHILLEDHLAADDTAGRAYALRLRQSAERMDGMIEDLLAYSRLARVALALEPVDLGALLVEVMRDMATELGERRADVLVEGGLPAVRAHRPTLARVLANLIQNAVKFVAPGQNPRVRIWCERRGDLIRLWVDDNGIGISPEYHQKIWGVFERLHKSEIYPGTGIGLAIVRKAMERMGGRAGLESEPGKGSRFYLEFEGDGGSR